MKRILLASHVTTAAVAAVLSTGVTMWASGAIPAAAADNGAVNVDLLKQPLPDIPGREVRMTLLQREPLVSSAPHRHPGHYTFGYVVEGTYEFGVNGQPPRILHAGDVFYEPPGALHSTSRNASPTEKLKIVVFMVADSTKPSTVVERK
ncbi:MAG TPA: cupin domain-containing protein [Micropepsaceae bacterium]|nr:cupin domain-containing protein [Micropepsaceae bacterium]